jgi:hypothetical protein
MFGDRTELPMGQIVWVITRDAPEQMIRFTLLNTLPEGGIFGAIDNPKIIVFIPWSNITVIRWEVVPEN